MSPINVGVLRARLARLRYKVRRSGSVLLMLPGGAGDADSLDRVVSHLTDRYRVVTYDRRGLSHSTIDDPAKVIGWKHMPTTRNVC